MGEVRVLHYKKIWLAQTEGWLFQQLRFVAERMSTTVFCERAENLDQFPWPGIEIHRTRPLRYFIGKALARVHEPSVPGLRGAIRRSRATIVHSHFGNAAWAASRAVSHSPARHVVSFYGFDATYLPATDPRWRQRYRELFDTAALVLAEGPVMAETIAGLGCPTAKIRVHHLGVPLDELPFRPRRWSEGEPLRVLLVGSFREKKGLTYALEALAALAIERDVAVTIIGDADHTGRAQEEKRRILAIADHPALRGRVRLLGFQPYATVLAEAYAHHIFLAPSVVASDGDTEGGAPVTLIELAATGMPVVASRHCDIPAVVNDGESGLLCPERDVDSLVGALRRLAADPQAWEPMAKAARRHIEVEFDAATQGGRLADLYEEVAA